MAYICNGLNGTGEISSIKSSISNINTKLNSNKSEIENIWKCNAANNAVNGIVNISQKIENLNSKLDSLLNLINLIIQHDNLEKQIQGYKWASSHNNPFEIQEKINQNLNIANSRQAEIKRQISGITGM